MSDSSGGTVLKKGLKHKLKIGAAAVMLVAVWIVNSLLVEAWRKAEA